MYTLDNISLRLLLMIKTVISLVQIAIISNGVTMTIL